MTGVAWSAEGKLATCSEDRTVVTSDGPGSGGAVGSPAEVRLTAASVDATLGFRDAADEIGMESVEHSSVESFHGTCRCCRMS